MVSAGPVVAHARLPNFWREGLGPSPDERTAARRHVDRFVSGLAEHTAEFWPSALVAALFAVHPQHVESVAWVSERKDVLSGLFFVLTLGAYLGYVRHGRQPTRYALLLIAFALALLAKPMVVTLPALLLLIDFWPLGQLGLASDAAGSSAVDGRPTVSRLVLEKIPLCAMALGVCFMTLETHATGTVSQTWSARLGNAAVSAVTYLVQLFYPLDLAAYYPFPPGGPPPWKVAGALAILIALSAAALFGRRRYPYAFVGWLWYLGMLTPVLGLIKIGPLAMADRYTYLPSIGLYIALAWGGTSLTSGKREKRWALVAGTAAALAVLIGLAAWQTTFWRDDETLWRHALACTADNGKAEIGLADALRRRGQADEAIAHYERAMQFAIDASPYVNFGGLLADRGKLNEAIALYRRALAMEPDAGLANLAYTNLARALLQQNRLDEARDNFRRAIDVYPRGVVAHCCLALILKRDKKIDEAREEFEQAVAIEPRNAAIRNDLALTILQQGKIDEAIAQFRAALDADPSFVPARVHLASVLAARGQASEAAAQYRLVLSFDPQNSTARQELERLNGAGSSSRLSPPH